MFKLCNTIGATIARIAVNKKEKWQPIFASNSQSALICFPVPKFVCGQRRTQSSWLNVNVLPVLVEQWVFIISYMTGSSSTSVSAPLQSALQTKSAPRTSQSLSLSLQWGHLSTGWGSLLARTEAFLHFILRQNVSQLSISRSRLSAHCSLCLPDIQWCW